MNTEHLMLILSGICGVLAIELDLMLLADGMKRATKLNNKGVSMQRGTNCKKCDQFRVFQVLVDGLCPECRVTRLRLVVSGEKSEARVLNSYQYETFLRNVSQTEFETHLTIDIPDAETAELIKTALSGAQ